MLAGLAAQSAALKQDRKKPVCEFGDDRFVARELRVDCNQSVVRLTVNGNHSREVLVPQGPACDLQFMEYRRLDGETGLVLRVANRHQTPFRFDAVTLDRVRVNYSEGEGVHVQLPGEP